MKILTCFLLHRVNYANLELFTDLLFVFIGSFATDFSFVRNYMTAEVIPVRFELLGTANTFTDVLRVIEQT